MIIKEDSKEYAEWWNKTLAQGEIADHRYNLKGFFVWMPYGFSIMKNIRTMWDELFTNHKIKEMHFPLFVPVEYAAKNESWWRGFKEEAFYVLGYNDKDKKVFIRPTGEPAMYPMFSTWIRSHRDLPFRIYQTVYSYRNETKSTKTLVRDVEIGPWYEIHTVHATAAEAEKEIELAIKMNEQLFYRAAIEPFKVRKPKADCFPGSVGAVEFYTVLNDGVVENGSCNNLGQAYAKAFDITFLDKDGKRQHAWQTCTGNGERILASVVSQHSDEKGLIIPPSIAPVKASVVLIKLTRKDVPSLKLGENVEYHEVNDIKDIGEVRFSSERRGIPVRIEIGPKELEKGMAQLVWRTGKKETVKIKDIDLEKGLEDMQEHLLKSSAKELNSRIEKCSTINEAKKAKIAIVGWCGDDKCGEELKTKTDKEIIGMTYEKQSQKCLICKASGESTYLSKSY